MNLKKLFNISLLTFIMVVPLVPFKIKLLFIPMSADFIFGAVVILLGMFIVIKEYRRDKHIYDYLKTKEIKILSLLVLLFVLLCLSSLFYAQSKIAVISEIMRFLEYIIIFYLVLLISDKILIGNGLMSFYFTMIIASLYGVVQYVFNVSYFNGPNIPFGRGRVYATFANPNYWGAAVNLVIFVPIVNLIEKRGKNIWIEILLFFLFMFNLLFCFTRGSWLAFGAGLFTICIIRYRKLLLSIPFMIMTMYIIPFTRERFLSIFNIGHLTNTERITLWKTGLYMFRDNFWFGVGNGNYLTRYFEYVTKYPELYQERRLFTVHNSYIKMFAETGIFGGILFLSVYLVLAYMCYKIYKDSKGSSKLYSLVFLGFWGTYLFQNFFNNLMFIPQLNVFVWIISALLYKKYLIERNEAKL